MAKHLRLVKAGSFISVPSILEDMAASSELQVLKNLAFVAFGGGKLRDSARESGPLAPIFVPEDNHDWQDFRRRGDAGYHPQPTGVTDDGIQQFRLSVQRPDWNSIFQIQDELVRAPLSAHQDYAAVGSTDDVLVLANGEKVRPGILEAEIAQHPDARAAVVFSDDQVEVGLLLQSAQTIAPNEYDAFVDSIWPDVEGSNLLMDVRARISSEQCILVLPHDAVLPRSDKASVLRREVYATFETEISDLCARLNNLMDTDLAKPLHLDRIEDDISKLIHEDGHLPSRHGTVSDDEDLFARGMDSLQAVQLRRRLQASLAYSPGMAMKAESLPRDFAYRFPSVQKMANALRGVEDLETGVLFDQTALDGLVAQYFIRAQGHAALVAGASGGLGSHIVGLCEIISGQHSLLFCPSGTQW